LKDQNDFLFGDLPLQFECLENREGVSVNNSFVESLCWFLAFWGSNWNVFLTLKKQKKSIFFIPNELILYQNGLVLAVLCGYQLIFEPQ